MDIQKTIKEGTFERDWRVCTQPSSLNPSLAYLMNQLAGLDQDDRVLDPCCGTGTILIERQTLLPCNCIGVDIDPRSLECAQRNLKAVTTVIPANAGIQLKHGDITELKFPDNYFTKIISNLPFGVRSGTREKNKRLYRFLADDSIKWLKPGGKAVFFTQSKSLLRNAFAFNTNWKLIEEYPLEYGGLTPSIFVFEKII